MVEQQLSVRVCEKERASEKACLSRFHLYLISGVLQQAELLSPITRKKVFHSYLRS